MGWSKLGPRAWHAVTKTLRFRLMLWNALLVALTAAATLIGVREGVRFALLRELDQILESDLGEIEIALEEAHRPSFAALLDELERKARSHSQQGWFVQLLDGSQRIIWSSGLPPGKEFAGQGEWSGWSSFGNRLRVRERRVTARSADVRLVRVGADLAFLAREVARIDRTAELMAGVVLLLAPLGGYVLAGRATRPLRQLTRVAARLRPSQLDERLPLRKSGDELDHLSATINGLLDRIASHLAQNRDLLANSAHELRSPLAAIRSSVEVALQSGRTLEEYEELLSEVIDECSTLETLVNQLLLLAETEADPSSVPRQRVAWSELVTKAVAMFAGAAEYAQIEMDEALEGDLYVEGNPTHLRQLLNNLLDNAVKFTPPGGRVTVRLERRPRSHEAILTVSDTGPGIPPEDLPRVFERFFRADRSRNRETTRGTGLGLSICQSIALAHRGSITLDSPPSGGTTATIILPLVS